MRWYRQVQKPLPKAASRLQARERNPSKARDLLSCREEWESGELRQLEIGVQTTRVWGLQKGRGPENCKGVLSRVYLNSDLCKWEQKLPMAEKQWAKQSPKVTKTGNNSGHREH